MDGPLTYLLPWKSIRDAKRVCLEKELATELVAGHVLFGKPMTAMAARADNDQVLFRIEGDAPSFAVVDLTWIKKPETEGRPNFTAYPTLAAFEQADMLPNQQSDATLDPA